MSHLTRSQGNFLAGLPRRAEIIALNLSAGSPLTTSPFVWGTCPSFSSTVLEVNVLFKHSTFM